MNAFYNILIFLGTYSITMTVIYLISNYRKNKMITAQRELIEAQDKYKKTAKDMIQKQIDIIANLKKQLTSRKSSSDKNGFENMLMNAMEKAKDEVMSAAPQHMLRAKELSDAILKTQEDLISVLMQNIRDLFDFIGNIIKSNPELQSDDLRERFDKLRNLVINSLHESGFEAYRKRKEIYIRHGVWEKEKQNLINSFAEGTKGSGNMLVHMLNRDESIDAFKAGKYENIISFLPEKIENEMQLGFVENSRNMILTLTENKKVIETPIDKLDNKDKQIRIALEKIDAIATRYRVINNHQ